MKAREVIKPQPGPQTEFLATKADIAIYGGAAGGGKSYALLLEPLRHRNNPRFGGIIFRRNTTQVRNEGGLWDESINLYSRFGGKPKQATLSWKFPKKMRMKFAHLEHDNTVNNYQGAQIPYIGFDELVHFNERQFWYMLSRCRSASGVPGYVRATCNPDADSWVRTLIDYWIGEDGYPLKELSGKLRWFIKQNDQILWADSKEELKQTYGAEVLPKSLTFIPSSVFDNKILLATDPEYLANLDALSYVDRMRLKYGNWNIRPSAGNIFQPGWFPVIDVIPSGWIRAIRFWDRAATKPHEENKDPDWTRGLLMYQYRDGTFVVADLRSLRDSPGQVERLVLNTAYYDGATVTVMSQQDPGSAGVGEAESFTRMLQGFDVRTETMPRDKLTRAKPVSAQAEAGNIHLLKAPWNQDFLKELQNFPDGKHDDCVDVLSGAFNHLASGGASLLDAL